MIASFGSILTLDSYILILLVNYSFKGSLFFA